MKGFERITCRGVRGKKNWAIVTIIAMVLTTSGGPGFMPVLSAQTQPVGAGFSLDAGDLRFIFHQIEIAQAHAAGGALFGPGPNQVGDLRFPFGLRTVDGSVNHIQTGTETFGAADQVFPRMTTPLFRQAEQSTSYEQRNGIVNDSQPRIISNLIADQTESNPAAVAVATEANGGVLPPADPLGTLPILNVAPDVGLSAPFNIMFTFFGQFFDHGLDLTNKGGNGTVFVPLRSDDPLFVAGSPTNFMVLTRATNRPGPDGVVGTDDDIQEATNQTTPWVDQNQTYTSHPSHQVFLREYAMGPDGPVSTGRMIDGGGLIGGVPVRNIGNWGEVKAQAAAMLGIGLVDTDVFNVPLLATDPYGRFLRGANGFPLMMMANGDIVEGDPGDPISTAGSLKTGHGFLDDIAHAANPSSPGHDAALLAEHFVTGDGRGNENIALTAVHTVFHAEHNRLRENIHGLINTPGFLTAAERLAWLATDVASGWDYGERLFQAARFVTEMEYQHLVFEEFARKVSPSINEFIGDGINFQSDTNPAIFAEFAHQTYRLGHSMLTEKIARTNADGSLNDIELLAAFLNPLAFNDGGTAGPLTAAQAAGAIFQGGTREVANEIDEFVTDAVRNNLVGLPLDLAVLNLARGRSEGVAPLNSVRRQLYLATSDFAVVPYTSWFDYSFSMKHQESLINFIAAYGTHPSLLGADGVRGTADDPTVAQKRASAVLLVQGGADAPADWADFFFSVGAWANDANGVTTTGLDNVDLWIGGLAERIAPFGGLLGSTFNLIFEHQLEGLQNADRFYYLERLDGLNLLAQLEANSFVELIARNTTLNGAGAADVFSRPDLIFNLTAQPLSGPIVDDPATMDVDETFELVRFPDGTIRYPGDAHVIWNGRDDANADRVISSEGDDTLRGNGGNDRMEGGAGNDNHIGGMGDDILTDNFGEDVIKGGPGNDAISGGLGPFDLLQGNEGHDFIVGGNDMSETFGGPGNDTMYTGDAATEAFGGAGDDWVEGGPQLDLLVGDENNQFQNDPNQGHDVIIGGKGDDDYDSEGGDDVMVADVLGTERLEGMLGFDWVTYRGDPSPVDADMNIRVVLPPNLDELRDRFDLAEALSGYNQNDFLRGTDRLAADMVGHELNLAGINRVSGASAILPAGATSFTGGDILMGGPGSDLIEGRAGDDIIDGDRWLNVQLRGALNDGTVKLVDSLHALRVDVFANPQRLNPANVTIVRSIVTTSSTGIDTAVFSGALAEYTVTNTGGVVTVAHTNPAGGIDDGTDTLRNIERLQFADVAVAFGNSPPTGTPVLSQALPQEGEALSVANGTIADADGIVAGSFTFQWQQGATGVGPFANIAGATLATFTPTQAQVGQVLRAIVSFTDNGGTLESVPSAPSGVVGDLFVGGAAADLFNGTAGRDNANGGGGNDTLTTGDAADVVLGAAGDDTLNTGAGDDIATGGAGDDVINAGDGNDSIRFSAAEGGFDTVNGGAGVDELRSTGAGGVIGLTSLAAIESIIATGADSIIQGSDVANNFNFAAVTITNIAQIHGGGGDDVITGSAVADNILGNAGNDTVSGGAGADTLEGEAGADTLNGGDANDTLLGGAGADSLLGDAGNDTLNGGGDNDTLNGGIGNDNLNGAAGNDDITGGAGTDTMNPGATIGTDVFRFAAGFGADTINGFGAVPSPGVVGQDLLNISALGITAATFAANVTIAPAANPANTLITITGGGTITLNLVTAANVTAADFTLAP